MATQTQYYNLDKPSYDEVADIEVINANFDKIDQQMRNNADGVNFAKAISSDAYDNSKLYAVGDYCIYDNKLYRCITAIESAEAFNIAKWEQTTVGKEVKQLNSNLVGLNTNCLSLDNVVIAKGNTYEIPMEIKNYTNYLVSVSTQNSSSFAYVGLVCGGQTSSQFKVFDIAKMGLEVTINQNGKISIENKNTQYGCTSYITVRKL